LELKQYKTSLNKDLIFTEIGYKSVDKCAYEPWKPISTTLNIQAQSNSYQAFLALYGI